MDVMLQLVPDVKDINEYHVTNQQVLVKPLKVEVIKTKGGIIITGASGPDGDGGAVDLDQTRANMLQRGIAISCGKRVEEIEPGMTVMYYKSGLGQMIRCEEELYYGIEEYNIKGYLKSN